MTWLAWRQHRAQLAAVAAVLGAYGLLAALEHANHRFSGMTTSLGAYLPMVIGLFWGAPLLARELESGTYQLAWTQSVTRQRWLAAKLALLATAAVAATGALSALLAWGAGPPGQGSPLAPGTYETRGLVPFAYALFLLALGTSAGAALRRTVPAIAVTLTGAFALLYGAGELRRHLLAPLRAPAGAGAVGPGDWVVGTQAGQVLYHPASRFWVFQGIEAGAFLALAAALLALTFWRLRRHAA